MYTKLFLVMSITFLTTTFTLLSFFTGSAFAQLEERNGINQTMQDISKSTNQSIQNTTQALANETGEAFPIQKNVTDLGANITEGAKDLVGNIGGGIQNLSSGNLSLIL